MFKFVCTYVQRILSNAVWRKITRISRKTFNMITPSDIAYVLAILIKKKKESWVQKERLGGVLKVQDPKRRSNHYSAGDRGGRE